MMSDLMGWVLFASGKGAILTLIALAFLWITRDLIPARWRYVVWAIVLVRFAVPMGPQSPLSLFNLLSLPAVEAYAIEVPAEAIHAARPQPVIIPVEAQSPARIDPAPILRLAAMIWLGGVIVLAARLLISSARLHWKLHREAGDKAPIPSEVLQLLEESKRALGVNEKIRVLETSLVMTPALHGIVNPALLLPDGFFASFDREELRFIFLHELAHLRRRDVLANWAIAAVQILQWFNPLAWLAAARIREERELACDEAALDCLQQDERPRYGRTMLRLLEVFRTHAPVPALLGILNGKHQMKRRLLMITRFRTQPRATLLFLALCITLATVALTDARAGEKMRFHKKLGDAEKATFEKLDAKVSFSLANATVADVLAALSSRTGVTISQNPAALADAAQQKRLNIEVETVPAHLALMETLTTVGLGFDIEANGITVNRDPGPRRIRVLAPAGAEGHGADHKFQKRIVIKDGEVATIDEIGDEKLPAEIEEEIEKITSGMGVDGKDKKIIVRKVSKHEIDHGSPDGAAKRVIVHRVVPGEEDMELKTDATGRRVLNIKTVQDGVESTGKLSIEVLQ